MPLASDRRAGFDLAMVKTVARMDEAAARLGGVRLVIVDEAHHAGALTVEGRD